MGANSQLRFYFNDEYSDAGIHLFIFGYVWVPIPFMKWTFTDITPEDSIEKGLLWDRGIYCCGRRSSTSYTLRKVIGKGGAEISPVFQKMLATLSSPTNPGVAIKGPIFVSTVKTRMQLVQDYRVVHRDVVRAPTLEHMAPRV